MKLRFLNVGYGESILLTAQRTDGSTFTMLIDGGSSNTASHWHTTIAGGIKNIASGSEATIGGGSWNQASGNYSTIPGGSQNQALGLASFAAGHRAQALHDNAFVWSDSFGPCLSVTANTFVARASSGFTFYTAAGTTFGAQLAAREGADLA